MTAPRPFETVDALYAAAHHAWWRLGEADWREGFAAHPMIGDKEGLRKKFEQGAVSGGGGGGGAGRRADQEEGWEAGEQSGADDASEAVLEALAQANQDYLAKFGFIFLVCATGKSADEMLAILQVRRGLCLCVTLARLLPSHSPLYTSLACRTDPTSKSSWRWASRPRSPCCGWTNCSSR